MQATATEFLLGGRVRAFENGTLACSRDFSETIPRELM